jgi:hypothetical protein
MYEGQMVFGSVLKREVSSDWRGLKRQGQLYDPITVPHNALENKHNFNIIFRLGIVERKRMLWHGVT